MSSSIHSDEELEVGLREIERLWGADEGSADSARLALLVALVEAYENECWPETSRVPNVETLEAMAESRAILCAQRERADPQP